MFSATALGGNPVAAVHAATGLTDEKMAALAHSPYVASQGTAIGREGRAHLRVEGDMVWVGGEFVDVVRGEISL